MTRAYSIDVFPRHSLICYAFRGSMDAATVAAWGAEREAAVRRLGGSPNSHLALYDLSEFPLPTQELFAQLERYIGDAGSRSRRVAVITASAIQRIQVRRMSGHDDMGFFTDRTAAENWLLGGADTSATVVASPAVSDFVHRAQ